MNGPLEGVRVVDLSAVLSGPVATRMLADQGADVIKVESLSGDVVRMMGPGVDGLTAAFLSSNRGKRSVAIDLKSAAGGAVLRRLCKTADVFVQNFRPGAVERMGLRPWPPRQVCCRPARPERAPPIWAMKVRQRKFSYGPLDV